MRTRRQKGGEVDLREYPRLRAIVVRMLREILEDEQDRAVGIAESEAVRDAS